MALSLELLEARQEIASLRAELRRVSNRERRLAWYIKTQMTPLVNMGIRQGNRIVTLERRLKWWKSKVGRLSTP